MASLRNSNEPSTVASAVVALSPELAIAVPAAGHRTPAGAWPSLAWDASAPSRVPRPQPAAYRRPLETEGRGGGYHVMTAVERQFLLDAGEPPDSFDREVQEAALARLRARAQLTAQQAAPELSVAEVADRPRCSQSTVRRCARQGDLYAVRRERALRFPEWQFQSAQRLPGLRAVLARLSDSMHPYSVEGWMTLPQEELDGSSPVEWLRGRPAERVLRLAESEART